MATLKGSQDTTPPPSPPPPPPPQCLSWRAFSCVWFVLWVSVIAFAVGAKKHLLSFSPPLFINSRDSSQWTQFIYLASDIVKRRKRKKNGSAKGLQHSRDAHESFSCQVQVKSQVFGHNFKSSLKFLMVVISFLSSAASLLTTLHR